MKPLLILSTSLYFLLLVIESARADDNKVAKIQQGMYNVIRVMALPDSAEKRGLVTERFIMLLPGEVLNYYDYCPIEKQKGEVFLPSRLPPDENTFLLTDKLPTAGESGNRLSTIYRDIVYTINTTGTGEEPFDKGYQDAMKFLREEVNDPEDPTSSKMPRFELYHRYKLRYYDTVSEVKGWIAGNQTAMKDRYGDYETWYHNHYQSLEAHSSASYSQWLINGQKSQVEEKISEVDIESVRSEIEDARRVLQEEELPSMDGGTVYYPVHLEPSNWYEYLIPRENTLTRGQIQAQLGDRKMRRAQLQAMMSAASPTEKELKALIDSSSGESTKRQKAIDDAAQAVKCYEYLCKAKNAKKLATLPATDSCKTKYKESDPCQEISKSRKKLEEASQAETEAQSVSDMMKNNLEAYKSTNPSLNAILVQLNNEIDELQKKYESAPTEAPILRKASGKGEMSGEEIAQNWMAFTFDSEKSSKSRDTSSSTTKVAASTSFFAQFTLGAGMSYSRSHQEFHEKMSSSDVSVSAKLLRVTINRNWFRPSIFRNSNLFKMQKGVGNVSPGPQEEERDFIKEVKQKPYLLPEYTTGFLLAKDVSMTFRGVESSTSSEALKQSASGSLSFGYGPFSISPSVSHGHSSSHLQVSSESDGLHIEIPGAQIIGYFTGVVDKFPA